jgi:hypothetical protein
VIDGVDTGRLSTSVNDGNSGRLSTSLLATGLLICTYRTLTHVKLVHLRRSHLISDYVHVGGS